MEIEMIKEYIGLPIKLVQGNFVLDGYIEKIEGDTLLFVTTQQRSLISATVVTAIKSRNRTMLEELCNKCNKIWIRPPKSSVFYGCPYCSDGCKGCE